MNKFLALTLCAVFIFAVVHLARADDEIDDSEYEANDARQFLQKRLFGIPFPREQRREAKEKYEERCERALGINKVTGLQRWCPKLEEWDQWRAATQNDKRRG
ncbi:unnamed protein product [Rotaria socialis]|uniref:Uncharacterized protein n=2 Tax=Rotaria socialis TaxID=392032 RepID=A0A820GZ71_9BILA|nr:unnamed protein product [Rotaria socialis]CAF3327533.1 unnamed protein product [Rotaria socialis]CAF3414534.1 unnamed protein product [Rotaria socialis]CAF3430817.1 unnamed protein product [Rotaria socialis]CAF3550364.1 unnamed protein product [Rotaria socialis]